MFNLLRMDLYRLKRCKSVYICFGILVFFMFVLFGVVYLSVSPEGRKAAEKMGMILTMELGEALSAMEGMDTLDMFRETAMDGCGYTVIYCIVVALFVCGDYKGGFMKNIMSLQKERWKYIGSKLMAAGILNVLYLALYYGVCMAINLLFHKMLLFARLGDVLFYLAWTWLLTTAFAAMVIMVCVFTKNATAGVCTAVFMGSGLVVVIVASIMERFQLAGWLKYTLYYNISYGPSAYSGTGDLKVFAVGLVFLALYSVVSAVALAKQDI